MSPGAELWKFVQARLKADPSVMAMVDDVYDKVPAKPWRGHQAYISRGPISAVDDGADCIDGQEFTLQVDIWSLKSSRWSCDDIVEAVRLSLHEPEDVEFADNALGSMRVVLTRVFDDPNPLTVHGVVQVVASVEIS